MKAQCVVAALVLLGSGALHGAAADNTAAVPNFGESTAAPEKVDVEAMKKRLKERLVGKTRKEVVDMIGKPDRVLNGNSDWFYRVNWEDEVTGAVYKHIQVHFPREGDGCTRVSVGLSDI